MAAAGSPVCLSVLAAVVAVDRVAAPAMAPAQRCIKISFFNRPSPPPHTVGLRGRGKSGWIGKCTVSIGLFICLSSYPLESDDLGLFPGSLAALLGLPPPLLALRPLILNALECAVDQVVIGVLLPGIHAGRHQGIGLGLFRGSTVSRQVQLAAAKPTPSPAGVDAPLIVLTPAGQVALSMADKTGSKGEITALPGLGTLPERVLVGAAVVADGLLSLRAKLDRVATLATPETDLQTTISLVRAAKAPSPGTGLDRRFFEERSASMLCRLSSAICRCSSRLRPAPSRPSVASARWSRAIVLGL